MNLQTLYQETIIDHGQHPRNFGALKEATHHAHGFNPLCGDDLILFLQIENNVITHITFTGKGCAISVASASLLSETLKNKTLSEAEIYFERFHTLLTKDDKIDLDSLGKLQVFAGVKTFPMRVKCATLAWHTYKAALDNKIDPVSTENL